MAFTSRNAQKMALYRSLLRSFDALTSSRMLVSSLSVMARAHCGNHSLCKAIFSAGRGTSPMQYRIIPRYLSGKLDGSVSFASAVDEMNAEFESIMGAFLRPSQHDNASPSSSQRQEQQGIAAESSMSSPPHVQIEPRTNDDFAHMPPRPSDSQIEDIDMTSFEIDSGRVSTPVFDRAQSSDAASSFSLEQSLSISSKAILTKKCMLLHPASFPRSVIATLVDVHGGAVVTREYGPQAATDDAFIRDFLLNKYSSIVVDCSDMTLTEASAATLSLLSRLAQVVVIIGSSNNNSGSGIISHQHNLGSQVASVLGASERLRIVKGFPREEAVRFALTQLVSELKHSQ